ncbi:Replicase polyprotein 1a [Orchesella cincta]|uniref:Replicase polyprotein 1a n=1 Tax=Orchesella cincta TaxID=48709 RepID=A0A1D2M7S2_ORCCI|nr:Replicase polyprotein 1a [Orchesella cincta]
MRIQSVFSLTQKKTENVPNNCLFCAVPCRRPLTTEDDELEEEGADLKRPKLDIDHLGYYQSSTFLEDEDPTVDKQLKAIFLLKNVLGIRKEKLCQFLGKFGGDNHPESWIKVCGSCGEAVKICFEVWREISKLERKLGEISKELRGHIWETREKRGDGEEEGAETVWRQVREDVLKGFDANSMALLEDDDDEEIKVAIGEIERDKDVEGFKDSENVATTSESSSEEVLKDSEVASPLLVDLDDEEDEDELVFEQFDSTVTSQTEEDEFADEEATGIFINGDIFIDEVEEEDDSDFQNINFTPPELNQIEDNSSPLEKRSGRKQELQ